MKTIYDVVASIAAHVANPITLRMIAMQRVIKMHLSMLIILTSFCSKCYDRLDKLQVLTSAVGSRTK